MSALSILALATGRPDDASVIAIAADLAKRHASLVTVVNAFETLAPVAAPMYAGAAVGTAAVWRTAAEGKGEVRRAIDAEVRRQAERFGLAEEFGVGAAIIVASGGATAWDALMRELPLADIVVVGHSSASLGGSFAGPFGEALMEAKAPVYVARDEISAAGHPAAVAWDGSLQAARAVRAAIPLLMDASTVAILQNPDELDRSPGAQSDPARLERYLKARGVVTGATIEFRGRHVGPALLTAAGDVGAAMLVAGAYGHSRLGEALFGGATRAILSAKTAPHLIVSH
jgi:nucleotide-binding universal stress UspA family protein